MICDDKIIPFRLMYMIDSTEIIYIKLRLLILIVSIIIPSKLRVPLDSEVVPKDGFLPTQNPNVVSQKVLLDC